LILLLMPHLRHSAAANLFIGAILPNTSAGCDCLAVGC
jgi:hypothetical protein